MNQKYNANQALQGEVNEEGNLAIIPTILMHPQARGGNLKMWNTNIHVNWFEDSPHMIPRAVLNTAMYPK